MAELSFFTLVSISFKLYIEHVPLFDKQKWFPSFKKNDEREKLMPKMCLAVGI